MIASGGQGKTSRFGGWCARFRSPLLLAAVMILLAGGWMSGALELKSDFSELLPEKFPSVIALKQILKRLGGVGNLIVVVEGPSFETNKLYIDRLASKLEDEARDSFRWLDYKNTEIENYYKDRFLHYLDVDELEEIDRRIAARAKYEETHHIPLYVDFLEEVPPSLDFDDIIKRHEGEASGPLKVVDGYYGARDGRMLLMLVRPKGDSLDVDASRSLVTRVKEVAASLAPASFEPPVTVGFCGVVVSTVEEYDILKKDILSTALLCLSLVGLVIILYFRSLVDLVLLTFSVLVAVAATFGITRGVIGYLTSQTAFLGALIVGTGINYGIILLARYAEERRHGLGPEEAIDRALVGSWQQTFLAAATTAVSFATLGFARNRGFSQFGFIGSVGVMLCWVSAMIFLPPSILLAERFRGLGLGLGPLGRIHLFGPLMGWLARRLRARPQYWIVGGLVIVIVSCIQIVRFIPNALEYDFTQLRSRSSLKSGTEALENRVSGIFHKSLTPAVVLVDDPEDEADLCGVLESREAHLEPEDRIMSSCDTIMSLLPGDQELKLPLLEKIGITLSEKKLRLAPTDVKEKIDDVRRAARPRLVTLDEIPRAITRYFEDLEGRRGGIAYVSPNGALPLSDGRNLVRFADLIREIALPSGRMVHGSGEKVILADLLRAIEYDAPRLILASLVGIFLLILITSRHLRSAIVILGGLVVGMVAMLGLQATVPIRINFFNFIAIPLTLGIGVDYGLNIFLRLKKEGFDRLEDVLRETGGAVVLCSTTTIISYFTLIIADSQVLATFGKIAIIGEVTCLASALLFVPALGLLLSRKETH